MQRMKLHVYLKSIKLKIKNTTLAEKEKSTTAHNLSSLHQLYTPHAVNHLVALLRTVHFKSEGAEAAGKRAYHSEGILMRIEKRTHGSHLRKESRDGSPVGIDLGYV